MMANVEPFLDFNKDYILEQYDEAEEHYEKTDQKPRPWSFGEIYRSMTGIYILGGRTTRTPGMYCRVDPDTGETTGRPLRQTNEYIHPSARSRTIRKGPGPEDEGTYKSHALENYKLRFADDTETQRPIAFWKPRSRVKGLKVKDLPER
jgi:hypothetical protein